MSFSVKIIRDSFQKTRPISDQVTTKFYETLFANHPEAEGLFHNVDRSKQRELLFNSLDFIVSNLENPERLSEYLQNLGSRHTDYGTAEEHFPWVGEALLQTFEHFFGDDWTDELASNWAAAFGTIKDYMMIGMKARAGSSNVVAMAQKESAPSSDSSSTSAPTSSWTAGMSIQLPDSVKQEIRDSVRSAIAEAVRAEIEAAVDEEISSLGDSDKMSEMIKKAQGAA